MYQPCPSSRQPVEPLRPPAPVSVLTAVKLMYAGAAVCTVSLIISIISVAFVGRSAATLRLAGRSQPLPVVIAVGIVGGLVVFLGRRPGRRRASSAPRSVSERNRHRGDRDGTVRQPEGHARRARRRDGLTHSAQLALAANLGFMLVALILVLALPRNIPGH